MASIVNSKQSGSPAVFSFAFIQVIDADHLEINRLAGRIRKLLASSRIIEELPELQSLITEVAWRLVRHDFCEDVVMRPAFVSILGDRGSKMAEEDRADHADGRDSLLKVLDEIESLQKDYDEQGRVERLEQTRNTILTIFDQFAEHMKVESGKHLPHFESVISLSLSRSLGKEYANALVLTPTLVAPMFGDDNNTEVPLFAGGADEYIRLDPSQLKEVYKRLLECKSTKEGSSWMNERAQDELDKLSIDKKPLSKTPKPPREDAQQQEPRKVNVPVNPLGLPIHWHDSRKGKL